MARAIHRVLSDEALRLRLSRNAAADAAARFDFRTTADAYLAWYEEILATTTAQEPTETVHTAEGDHVYA
jgi:glycosyltransferase involved in cell wall biosynthesis